jgi:methyl-accepting chemotaxis protein
MKEIKGKNNVTKVTAAKSIKTKLVMVLFIGSTMLLTLTGIVLSTTINSRLTENEKKILSETSQSVSKDAELFFDHYNTIAMQMAQDKNIQNFLLDAEPGDDIASMDGYEILRNTLIDTQKSNSDVMLSAYIAEADPSYYVDDLSGVSDASFDLKTREYYKTITDDVTCITEPYVDAATGSMVITITAPVHAEGKIIGLTGRLTYLH